MSAILIIDDNPAIGTALELLLVWTGTGQHAASPRAGLDALARESIDLVIQDMNFG